MNVKHLRKQLMAAIAMVVVAGVALSSATYAWFVTNNTVTAETTQIKAQSNAAFMSIVYDNGEGDAETAVGSTQTESHEWNAISGVALYPATVQNKEGNPFFVTGYGTAVDNGALSGSYIDVGAAAKAVTDKYAIGAENNFKISSAGVDMSNLVIDSVEVTVGSSEMLASAVRVLVVGSNNWQVWKAGANAEAGLVLEKTTDAPLATTIKRDADTPVSVYVFYDGDDANVKTVNLEQLEEFVNVTISFSATQPNTIS